ncbi:MepB family protein [Flavivirga aquatica]|uniref:MepB family protein n=1 Tax=Flavivirga aquatica TaxID=1849968 RepID=A0A1E5T8I2_9FLAO|nr:MepB family protein [Flavivirga aquatica]OEK07617.1 MepB family protein [Flavivirga aquatica]
MNNTLNHIKTKIYDPCGLQIYNLQIEPESKAYDACQFELNGLHIVYRNAKITPKKVGQFVTFWKRSEGESIEPFQETDQIDCYVINVQTENRNGQFVFPKQVLIKKGIISTNKKEGKRGFRVYPIWDIAKNKQAERTQKWQLDYFFEINDSTNFKQVKALYAIK